MSNAFISFAHQDEFTADAVRQALVQAGVTCWMFTRNPHLKEIDEAIVKEIKRCDVFVVLVSQYSIHSEWVLDEFGFAKKHGRWIVSVLLEKNLSAALPAALKLHQTRHQFYDLSSELATIPKLVQVILEGLATSSGPTPTPPDWGPITPGPAVNPGSGPIKRRNRVLAAFAAAMILAIMMFGPTRSMILGGIQSAFNHKEAPGPPPPRDREFSDLDRKLRELTWIAYDPVDHDDTKRQFPTDESVTADLDVLHHIGFRGIITFGSEGTLHRIPQLAHQAGFDGVIMGIADPADETELKAAAEQVDYVDGYCVGHCSLSGRYRVNASSSRLLDAMSTLKTKTRKPVTTTESIAVLRENTQLFDACDWVFPDIHAYWHDGATPQSMVEFTIQGAKEIAEFVPTSRGKPIALKMICFPSAGAAGCTPESQRQFFQLLMTRIRNDVELPPHTRYTFFAGFDSRWKVPPQWAAPEQWVGLCDLNRNLKPAAQVLAGILNKNKPRPLATSPENQR